MKIKKIQNTPKVLLKNKKFKKYKNNYTFVLDKIEKVW